MKELLLRENLVNNLSDLNYSNCCKYVRVITISDNSLTFFTLLIK